MACVLDIVMAGTETTSITLQWAALLMAKHPSVQGERAGCPGVRQDGPSHPRAGVPQAQETGSGGHGCPPSRPQAWCRRS